MSGRSGDHTTLNDRFLWPLSLTMELEDDESRSNTRTAPSWHPSTKVKGEEKKEKQGGRVSR